MMSITDSIAEAERLTRHLEPTPAQFKSILDATFNYCCRLIDENRQDPDDRSKHPSAKALYLYDEDAAWTKMSKSFSKYPEQPTRPTNSNDESDDDDDDLTARVTKLIERLDSEVARAGCNFQVGTNWGYVPGGSVAPTALGDLISAVTNRFCSFFPAQPGPVCLETSLIDFMVSPQCLGFANPESDAARGLIVRGFFASGGSTSILSALVAARDKARVVLGSPRYRTSVVYKTTETHSSFEKALHIAGLTRVVVRNVERGPDRRMSVESLRGHIARDAAAGLVPWLLCATVGSTNTGAVDPLSELADVLQEHNESIDRRKTEAASDSERDELERRKMWYHIDGAYGGLFALCESKRALFHAAFSRADSLVVDPHKSLFTAFGSAVCLVRDGEQLRLSHTTVKRADYLDKGYVPGGDSVVDSTDLSPELSKHNRMMRLWINLKLFGVAPYRAALEEKVLLAQYLSMRLRALSAVTEAEKGIKIHVIEPQLSAVVFRIMWADDGGEDDDDDEDDEDDMTLSVETKLNHSGRFFLSPTTLDGRRWLRVCILVFRVHRQEIDALLMNVEKLVGDL